MAAYRGVGPGFDVLRIGLALAIFVAHTKWAAGLAGVPLSSALDASPAGAEIAQVAVTHTGPLRPVQLALVPMFFALSGYLIMGSAVRLRTTPTFLMHRTLRIVPALVVEVGLSALVLGPIFTTLPLATYFQDPAFWSYFGNVVGHVSFQLPGVFLTSPAPDCVNVNLWTLPSEFYCYLITAACMAVGLLYRRNLFTALVAVAFIGMAVAHAATGLSSPTVPFPNHVIIMYFVGGLLFYHWQDHIPAHPILFGVGLVASYACLSSDATIYLAPLPLIYVTLYVGLIPMPELKFLSSGDYSYGVYLYGFPITQALVAWSPATFVGHGFLLLTTALPLTILFAAASWHGIEKHALTLKRQLPQRWFALPRIGTDSAISDQSLHAGAQVSISGIGNGNPSCNPR